MKFSQYTWSLYKQSEQGKEVIASFLPEVGYDCYDLAVKYNPHMSGLDRDFYADLSDIAFLWMADNEIESLQDAENAFQYMLDQGMSESGSCAIPAKDYKYTLVVISPISFGFYARSKFFIPNLFQYNFYALKRLSDFFELELPVYPKKSDYRARCMYYWELCKKFYRFRLDNGLSPEELCAFIYDFTPNLFEDNQEEELPEPTNAWFIGGVLPDNNKDFNGINTWQGNSETKKGDILIHYETVPVSAITCMWRAVSDGVIDPFFHWYSWVRMSRYTKIPSISIHELKSDSYFSTHPLVCKNFQGVNGWQITGRDYSELLRIITQKSGNANTLPSLYVPPAPNVGEIKRERDVEVKLIEYYLGKMGFVEGRDYKRQLSIRAGRGSRIIPDYVLHYDETPGYDRAKILIEAKLEMRNNIQIEECFQQAYSYAKLLESSVIMLCDQHSIILYQKKDSFDRSQYIKIYWGELEYPDMFHKLKNMLSPYN